MGKRSRMTSTRRERRRALETSVQKRARINLRARAFCWIVAMVAETEEASKVIAWMSQHCHMTEEEAAESIAIGRRVMARSL